MAFVDKPIPLICHKKKTVTTLFPGDKVDVEIDSQQANIISLQPRSNLIPHPRVANVERILFMVAAQHPPPDLWVIDQFLHYWQINNIPVTMLVNKMDLLTPATAPFFKNYEDLGCSLLYMEALSLTEKEKNMLFNLIRNKTVMLAGQSGVGKSTLLRSLVPASLALTGDVSKKNQRGRQTTKQTSLHYCHEAGAQVVDTPGFSMVTPTAFTLETTQQFYADVLESAPQCRFPDCRHIHEPGCAVKLALEKNNILTFRYQNYLKTLALLEKNKKW